MIAVYGAGICHDAGKLGEMDSHCTRSHAEAYITYHFARRYMSRNGFENFLGRLLFLGAFGLETNIFEFQGVAIPLGKEGAAAIVVM